MAKGWAGGGGGGGRGGWSGGCPEEAGVEFRHLYDTLVASPGLLEVFSLFCCCFLF